MRPHPRIRKTIKWGGAAVTVLLVVVWVGSGWLSWEAWQSPTLNVQLIAGRLCVSTSAVRPVWLQPTITSRSFGLFVGYQQTIAGDIAIRWIPIWPIALVSLLPTAAAWRLDTLARRRARLNLCPKCHYDRTGLAAGAVCPECGSAPSPTLPSPSSPPSSV